MLLKLSVKFSHRNIKAYVFLWVLVSVKTHKEL